MFGAYYNKHAIGAREVEKFLVGKSVTASVLLEAIQLLRETIVPIEALHTLIIGQVWLLPFCSSSCKLVLRGLTELGKDASLDISNAVVPDESLGAVPVDIEMLCL